MPPLGRSFFFAVTLALAASSLAAQSQPASNPQPSQHSNKRPVPTDQQQFAVYWTTEPGWHTQLQLRNNLEEEDPPVTPALRTANGDETVLPAVIVKPGDVVSVDLHDTLMKAAPQLIGSWGSVVFRYRSTVSGALYAAVMMHANGRPIVFHLDAHGRGSTYETGSRESVWWLPFDHVTDYLILTNSGDQDSPANLILFDSGGKAWQQPLTLSPRETRRLSVRALLQQAGLHGAYGGIKIDMAKGARFVDSAHLLFDESGGFSAMMKMFNHDPSKTLLSRSFGGVKDWTTRAPMLALTTPDPALGFPDETALQPKLFIHNAAGKAFTAHIYFNWRSAAMSGKTAPLALPFKPNETQELDVAALQAQKFLPSDANWATVILSAPVLPEELLAVAASYDRTGRYGTQTPFNDQLASHWEAGAWQVDSTHNSLVTISNGGNKPALAQITILYNQGTAQYQLEQPLAPDEQMVLDFAKLIHDQVPDKNGNTLPHDLTWGTYRILDLADEAAGSLYEGKVILDKTYGHATYGCMICCGPESPLMQYDPLTVAAGSSQNQTIQAVNSCTNRLAVVTGDFPTWWTDNTSIATTSNSQINGIAAGSTDHHAQSIMMYWGPKTDSGGGPCPQNQEPADAGTNVKPTISGPTTLWWFNGLSVGVSGYANQINLTSSAGGTGTSFQWAITAGSSRVSLSTSTSSAVQVTSIGQSTAANDVSITVTVGGLTSDPFKLTVRAPYTLGVDPQAPTPIYSQDQTLVWNIFIPYRVLDNLLTPMPNPFYFREDFTTGVVPDYPNENWPPGTATCSNTSNSMPASIGDYVSGVTPSHTPTPVYNPQQNGPPVDHVGQDWRIGSCNPGSGPRVQTDTLQSYTDHAAHTVITSPAP